jgi:hypothetical protein
MLLWRTYARAVIKRWEIIDEDGNWVEGFERVTGEVVLGPVSEENLIELFKAVPEFFKGMMADSTSLQYYVIEQAEEESKNSSSS